MQIQGLDAHNTVALSLTRWVNPRTVQAYVQSQPGCFYSILVFRLITRVVGQDLFTAKMSF